MTTQREREIREIVSSHCVSVDSADRLTAKIIDALYTERGEPERIAFNAGWNANKYGLLDLSEALAVYLDAHPPVDTKPREET